MVFTPYPRVWAAAARRPVLEPPPTLHLPEGIDLGSIPDPSSVEIDALHLPAGGETAGRALLDRFVLRSASYGSERDALAADSTSRLSPYLRFGCVSANEVAARITNPDFVRQLAWRDFFGQLLAAEARLLRESLRQAPAPIRSRRASSQDLEDWKQGRTGHPLVDAAMRQLAAEGWLPNRARLVVASYLTRTLAIDWREGAAHFDRLLVDGDPANNAGNWQWVAGTGANPRPSRALSPDRQAKRFDPDGEYVRRHLGAAT
jgi:deoxyribodipyrimidine photo-lyase